MTQFSQAAWNEIVTAISRTFRFTEAEETAFSSNETAHLIAAIPFIAGCDEAERTAIAHLSVYIAAIRGGRTIFDHTETDDGDILNRLRLIMQFKGGNREAIGHGMNLLALVMVNGYKRDQDKDRKSGEYNPLNSGAWNYDETCGKLTSAIRASFSDNIASLMSVEGAYGKIWS